MGWMRIGLLSGLVLALAGVSLAHGAEKFIPKGHSYTPESDRLPPLNSPPDRLDAITDVFESEIYHRQFQQRMFESEIDRFIQHDFSRGPLTGPTY